MARAEKRHDTGPLVRLIKSYVHENGGRKNVENLTTINSDSTYGARNRSPEEYQLGELISFMNAYKIPKVDFLMCLLSVFEIPSNVVAAAAVLKKLEEGK